MKRTKHKILSVFLSFCMIISCMVGMSMTAQAATKTVTWNASDIVPERPRDESFTKDGITFAPRYANFNDKNFSRGGTFTTASGKFTKIEVTAPYVDISGTGWSGSDKKKTWTGDASSSVSYSGDIYDMEMGQLKIVFTIETADATHSVTITPGSNMTKTTDSGAASQTGLSGAMTAVVYTANEGYYFPEDYAVTAVNGISVTRNSSTQITVSGTPSANAEITLTAPTAKTTPNAPTAAATDCTTADNNDGKLTGVTAAMEYKKSDAENWTAGTGSDITGLVPGTYYVRVKATDTANASGNQELTIAGYASKPTVNVEPSDAGTASVEEDPAKSENWLFTATPKEGYKFKWWALIHSNGRTGTYLLNPNSIAKTNFTESMRESGTMITGITAVFEEDDTAVTYTLVPAKAATCTATGNKEYYTGSNGKLYTKSGDTYTETTLDAVTIAKTAHTLTAVAAVDAKCTTDGTKAHYKCSVCEKLFEDADGKTETTADALKVTKLGHDYVNGKCTRCGETDPDINKYSPVMPTYIPTTTTTTDTAATTTTDIKNYNITGKQDETNESALTWDAIPDASAYSLYIDVGGKYVYVQDLGTATNADVVRATNGKYYVSTGKDYTIYEYDSKKGTFTQTGTLNADDIDSVKKANNVTENFMVKYTVNGTESTESNSYKTSVSIYYKPALGITAGDGFVRVTWAKVDGAEKYRAYKVVNDKLKFITETDKHALLVNGTKAGREYAYAVKAFVDGNWTEVYRSDVVRVTAK